MFLGVRQNSPILIKFRLNLVFFPKFTLFVICDNFVLNFDRFAHFRWFLLANFQRYESRKEALYLILSQIIYVLVLLLPTF